MAGSFAPGLTALDSTSITKVRELPIKGEIVCQIGDEVTADQVIARAEMQGEMRIVRVAEELGISPTELDGALKVKEGDTVVANSPIAEISGLWGLFRQSVVTPISGVVEFISASTGHVGIRAPSRNLELTAYISGKVVGIVPERSVTISTVGAFVQGIFGVGGERLGKLRLLPIQPNEVLDLAHIPADAAGQILVGGSKVTLAAIKAAVKAHAVGLVTSSIDDVTLREYVGYDIGVAITGDEDLPLTLIITEGFGGMPLSDRVLTILKKYDGKVCSINGATQVRAGAVRPEVIIPTGLPQEGLNLTVSSVGQEGGALAVGGKIRCIRVPYFGEVGTILELPSNPEKIETGAVTRVLRARLDNGLEVTVPRANVERI